MRTIARLVVLLIVLVCAVAPLGAAAVALPRAPVVAAPSPGLGLRALGMVSAGAALAIVGAIRLKSTAELSKKFVRNAGAAAGDYTDGVKSAGGDWETNAAASGDNYATGVQQAIGDKRFERGIRDAGAARFVTRASTLGAQRYPTGVAAAEGDWAAGAQPYLQILAGLDLPPRRPKGDPGNFARSQAVATRLRAAKVGK